MLHHMHRTDYPQSFPTRLALCLQPAAEAERRFALFAELDENTRGRSQQPAGGVFTGPEGCCHHPFVMSQRAASPALSLLLVLVAGVKILPALGGTSSGSGGGGGRGQEMKSLTY